MRRLLLLLVTGCAAAPKAEPCDVATFEPHRSPEERARMFLESCGREETIALTEALVRFPTVRADQEAADGEAFVGMEAFLETWATGAGFTLETFGKNDAWEIHFGDGEPLITFVMHADVVQVDETKWSSPPFEMRRTADRLYGRGTEDDKGPIAAVLVAMHTLKRFGVKLPGRITAVMGTGEEHDWDGMVAYAKERPHGRHVISLDANYPVVVAESGFVAWRLAAPLAGPKKEGCAEVTEAHVGQFLTQVPGEVSLTIAGRSLADVEKALGPVEPPFTVRAEQNGKGVRVVAKGESVHSSEADRGHNPVWALSKAAAGLDLCPGGVRTMMDLVRAKFAGDHFGEKLGLTYEHPVMGKLLVAPTMMETKDGQAILSVNMRRPAGKSVADFEAALDHAHETIKTEISSDVVQVAERRYVGKPTMVDVASPLVKTLLEIYAEKTGEKAPQPIAIRGGTYARLFPGAVDFGPSLPGRAYRGHVPDEYVEIEALQLMLETSAEAMLRLK